MALGAVTKFNQMESVLLANADRQWDDATAGSCMFVLAKDTYTVAATHTTISNVGIADTDYIATGDGAPVAVATPTIDATTTPGTTYLDSDPANFGSTVTITAKYLLCVQPVVAGTVASTSKLLWYVDLETLGGSKSSTSSDFLINQPANGWLDFT